MTGPDWLIIAGMVISAAAVVAIIAIPPARYRDVGLFPQKATSLRNPKMDRFVRDQRIIAAAALLGLMLQIGGFSWSTSEDDREEPPTQTTTTSSTTSTSSTTTSTTTTVR